MSTSRSAWLVNYAFATLVAATVCTRAIGNDQVFYPQHFLWGATVSAHQVEGSTESGEAGDWWQFERSSQSGHPRIADGSTADRADNHWNRFNDDFAIGKKIGLNSIKVSLAWEKIEPTPGVFNSDALDHYRQVIASLRSNGMRPMVVLHQFTHPTWFNERGGWTSPDSPRLFLEYATQVITTLGDLCDLWVTFEEPMTLVYYGYLNGQWPPAIASADAAFEAAFQIARAHRITAVMIHDKQGFSPGARGDDGNLRGVGVTQRVQIFDAEHPSNDAEKKAAQSVAQLMNWSFIDALTKHTLTWDVPQGLPSAGLTSRVLPAQDLPTWDVGPAIDWLGISYFTRMRVRLTQAPMKISILSGTGEKGDDGASVYPLGLEKNLRDAAKRYPYPLVVSANGVADVGDVLRDSFLHKHFDSLDRAVYKSPSGPPLDVRGYYHYSLLDGFEWLGGYTQHFGLIEVCQDDPGLPRKIRDSATIYSQKIGSVAYGDRSGLHH
jgi:beta-glucosidase